MEQSPSRKAIIFSAYYGIREFITWSGWIQSKNTPSSKSSLIFPHTPTTEFTPRISMWSFFRVPPPVRIFPLLCVLWPSTKAKCAKIIRNSASFSFRPAVHSTCFSKSCPSQRYSNNILQYFASRIEHQSTLLSHETKSVKMQGWFQTEFGQKSSTSSGNIQTTKTETTAAHFSCEFFFKYDGPCLLKSFANRTVFNLSEIVNRERLIILGSIILMRYWTRWRSVPSCREEYFVLVQKITRDMGSLQWRNLCN